jgi:hypothetical protein
VAKPDSWELALETKEQARARNLAARDAARPGNVPFPKTRQCGLCDNEKPFLVGMKRLDGKGGLFACSACIAELLGK